MSTTGALPRENSLLPQRADGMAPGAMLSVLVHLLLVAGLAFSVVWHLGVPQTVSAELWSAVPQFAAPKEVVTQPPPPQPAPLSKPAPREIDAPPPPPKQALRDAQIAIEKAEHDQQVQHDLQAALARKQAELAKAQKAEQEARAEEAAQAAQAAKLTKTAADKAAADKAAKDKTLAKAKADKDALAKTQAASQAQADVDKRKQQDNDARLAKQRLDNLKQIMGQAGATGSENATGTALRDSGPSASYGGKVIAAILPNILSIRDIDGDPVTEVAVHCAPDGTILSRRIVKSSGDKEWDDEVIRAVDRTARLPRDVDGRAQADMILSVNPKAKAR